VPLSSVGPVLPTPSASVSCHQLNPPFMDCKVFLVFLRILCRKLQRCDSDLVGCSMRMVFFCILCRVLHCCDSDMVHCSMRMVRLGLRPRLDRLYQRPNNESCKRLLPAVPSQKAALQKAVKQMTLQEPLILPTWTWQGESFKSAQSLWGYILTRCTLCHHLCQLLLLLLLL
jgi:hypothetical protein